LIIPRQKKERNLSSENQNKESIGNLNDIINNEYLNQRKTKEKKIIKEIIPIIKIIIPKYII